MKICFWGDISGALLGRTPGGGELQIALLAKALANSGYEVVVVDPSVKDNFITVDGIKVIEIKGWNKGIPIIRYLTHRIRLLYKTLKAQKADIYYCRIRDFRHIIAYRAARKLRAKFVLGITSDLEVRGFGSRLKYEIFNSPINFWSLFNNFSIGLVYPYLLKHADFVLAQHEGQREYLLKRKIHSVVFYNIIEDAKALQLNSTDDGSFIYVGSLDKRKGFPEFYDLVIKTPQIKYKVIGQPRDKTGENYYQKISSCPNVKLFGRLDHQKTIEEIAKSKALISTSPMEGFPNIFLEAWIVGVPVISLNVNPGNIFDRSYLGLYCKGEISTLIDMVKFFQNRGFDKDKMISYANEIHGFPQAAQRFINALMNDKK